MQQALLPVFGSLRRQPWPAGVARFGDAVISVMGQTQVGARETEPPTCDRWAKGVWSDFASASGEGGGLIGMASLADARDSPFTGVFAAQAIVYAPADRLRELDRPPSDACETIKMSDTQRWWTADVTPVSVRLERAGDLTAYKLVDVAGDQATVWTALLRQGSYLMEIRFADLGAGAQDGPVPATFLGLVDAAATRARSILG